MFDVRPTENLEDFQRAFLAIGQYFGAEPTPERAEKFSQSLPFERMHAAREDGAIVGGAGVFPFELSVPGAIVRCAGVTVVGVYPTHRRRGVLRAMMRAQLDDIHERGEPIAALWASEEVIYRRYGYGIASLAGEIELASGYTAREVRGKHFAEIVIWPFLNSSVAGAAVRAAASVAASVAVSLTKLPSALEITA